MDKTLRYAVGQHRIRRNVVLDVHPGLASREMFHGCGCLSLRAEVLFSEELDDGFLKGCFFDVLTIMPTNRESGSREGHHDKVK